jgi:hypothetical protein
MPETRSGNVTLDSVCATSASGRHRCLGIGRIDLSDLPAATGGLDQCHAGDQLPTQQRDGAALVGQGSRLGGHHRQVGHGAGLVLAQGQPLGQLGGFDGLGLDGAFLVQHAQGRQVVLHILQAGQDRLLVLRGGGVIGGQGGIVAGTACATVEEGLGQSRTQRPDPARGVEEIGEGGVVVAAAGGERERGK